jgi:hypothetical protein
MALKELDTNHYIKLDLNGNFKVYKSSRERSQEKKAPTFEKVVTLYRTILVNLKANKERLYYDADFAILVSEWEKEYETYLRAHQYGQKHKNFPLIKKYIKDIEKTLPEIVCTGQIGVDNLTLEEVYKEVKRRGLFGKVEDC